jgi:hypothetical protein
MSTERGKHKINPQSLNHIRVSDCRGENVMDVDLSKVVFADEEIHSALFIGRVEMIIDSKHIHGWIGFSSSAQLLQACERFLKGIRASEQQHHTWFSFLSSSHSDIAHISVKLLSHDNDGAVVTQSTSSHGIIPDEEKLSLFLFERILSLGRQVAKPPWLVEVSIIVKSK